MLLIHGWQGDHRYMQEDVDAAVFEAAGGWRRIPGHTGRAPDGARAAPAHVTIRRDPAAFSDLEPDLAGHWLGRVERPAPFHALLADWIDRMEIDAGRSDAGDRVP